MSQGARNWPFFTLTTFPVRAASTSRSVCRHRKAGDLDDVQDFGGLFHLTGFMDVADHRHPQVLFDLGQDLEPSSRPGPLKESREDRLALS